MSEQNQSLTLAGRLHLCPCHTWPSVDLSNCSDASGAGKVLQEERLPSEDVCSCLCCLAVACGMSSFLPRGKSYALGPLASQTAVLSHLGRLPSQQEKLFSPRTSFLSVLAAFHCTFTDSTLSVSSTIMSSH